MTNKVPKNKNQGATRAEKGPQKKSQKASSGQKKASGTNNKAQGQNQPSRAEFEKMVADRGWRLARLEVESPDLVKPGSTILYDGQRYKIRGAKIIKRASKSHREPNSKLPQGDLFGTVQPDLYELVLSPHNTPKPKRKKDDFSPFNTNSVAKKGDPPPRYSQHQIDMMEHALKYERYLQE